MKVVLTGVFEFADMVYQRIQSPGLNPFVATGKGQQPNTTAVAGVWPLADWLVAATRGWLPTGATVRRFETEMFAPVREISL